MVGALRDSLLPLYIISKISCTHTFSRKRLRTSFFGSLIAAFVAIAYAIFHVESAHRTLKDDKYEASVNAMTAIIDSYNRYSGVCGFGIIIVASIMVQGKIVRTIQLLEHVDSVLQQNYSHHVDNTAWIIRVTIQWFVLIGLYTSIEHGNCLMYIKDAAPLVDSFYKCYIMCLVPNYVTGTIEIQLMAYLQLIRNRLKLLNRILVEFRPTKRSIGLGLNQHSLLMGHAEIDANYFLDGIGAYAFKRESKLQFAAPVAKISKTQKRTTPWHQVAFSSLGWIIKMLGKPRDSIADFRVAPATSSNNFLNDLQNVEKLQEAYTKLEQAAILINSSYSVQLIVILIIKFTTLTSLLYICCMMIIEVLSTQTLIDDKLDQLFSSCGWIGLFGLEIFVVCCSCSATKTEAKRIGSNLHHYAMECNSVRCKRKMKSFSMHLLHKRIDFSPFGLFKLDLSFMYALIGAICTYLIILIQFDLAQKTSISTNDSTTMSSNASTHQHHMNA